jgi:LmbE family N-acetylglucosaminyl deacetylase
VAIDNLAEVRKEEAAAAARLLGADLLMAQIPDAELADIPSQRRTVIDLVRQFRPTLVLAHNAADYHPDHRAASALAEAASWFAASRGVPSDAPPLEAQPALWWLDAVNMAGFEPGFFLDISPFVELKHQMLRCHQSQRQRALDQEFASLEELMRRQYLTRGAQASALAAEAFRASLHWKRAGAW